MRTPAFQAYPKEWLSSDGIAMMTPAQEGAYWRLLCYAWLDADCSIPSDDDALAQLSRLGDQWRKGGHTLVKAQFRPLEGRPDRLVNDRLLLEREKQRLWKEKSSEGGKLGAEKRWMAKRKKENKGGHRVVTANDNQTMALQFAVCSLQLQHTNKASAEEIWEAYPLKVGKAVGIKAIEKQMTVICPTCLLEKTKQFEALRRNSLNEFPKVPNPSTWFNQQRFNDDPSTWAVRPDAQTRPKVDRVSGTHNAGKAQNYA